MLEHHSGVQFDLEDGAPPEQVRRALAAENWDVPVVVTTAVQLFESMYANRLLQVPQAPQSGQQRGDL